MRQSLGLGLGSILALTCFTGPRSAMAAAGAGDSAELLPARTVFLSPSEPASAPDESSASQKGPLINALDQVGIGRWLTANRINAFGWIEGSYNYNFDNPRPRLNLGHLFDIQDGDAVINQLQVNFERTVGLSPRQFDLGGRIDLLYGSDARFIHSSDLLDHQGGQAFGVPSQQYQFDIPQLYVDVALPVGNGLRLRFGKFEFFKFTDPNASPFFSHPFFYTTSGEANASRLVSTQVGASLPFTLTGATCYYEFSKQVNLEAGIGRGFDQSLTDNNGAIDGFGRVSYSLSDQTSASFALITGPEISRDNSHYRTVVDVGVSHSVSDDLQVLVHGIYGTQARPQTLDGVSIGGDAHWYGLSGNAVYRINRNLSVAGRFEWYRDEQGFTTGYPRGLNLYEATAGLTITPFPDSETGRGLKIRPEIRYDFSDKHYFINVSPASYQWIAAVDAIYSF